MPTASNAVRQCAKTKKNTASTVRGPSPAGGDNFDDSDAKFEEVFSGTCGALLDACLCGHMFYAHDRGRFATRFFPCRTGLSRPRACVLCAGDPDEEEVNAWNRDWHAAAKAHKNKKNRTDAEKAAEQELVERLVEECYRN